MGFLEVVSGPLVRSSYRAEQVLERNNVGLDPAVAEGIRETAALRC
jgi:lipoic acid synthetase